MDIGILVPATSDTKNIADIAQRVEGLGFESLWIPEHPVIPVGFKTEVPGGGKLPDHYNRWADPFIALTVAATATKRIKLATGICLKAGYGPPCSRGSRIAVAWMARLSPNGLLR